MDFVNLDVFPSTTNINYYNAGVIDGNINYSLDPNGNPVYYNLSSLPEAGVKSAVTLMLWNTNTLPFTPRSLQAGVSITIFGITFTASTTPKTAFEFLAANDPNDYTQRLYSVQSLVEAINSNSTLSKLLVAIPIITDSVTNRFGVRLTMKLTGRRYSLIEGVNITISGYLNGFLDLVVGEDASRGERFSEFNYSIFLEIWRKASGVQWGRKSTQVDDEKISEIKSSLIPSNDYLFDVQKYLENISPDVEHDYNIPNGFNQLNSITNYYVKWGESFNGEVYRFGYNYPHVLYSQEFLTVGTFPNTGSITHTIGPNGDRVFQTITGTLEWSYLHPDGIPQLYTIPATPSTFVFSGTNPGERIDVITRTTSGTYQILSGAFALPGERAIPPFIPNDCIVLLYVNVPAGTVSGSNPITITYPYGPKVNLGFYQNTANYWKGNLLGDFGVTRKYQIGETGLRWTTTTFHSLETSRPAFADYWQEVIREAFTGDNITTPRKIVNDFEHSKLRRRLDAPEYIYMYLFNDERVTGIRNTRLRSIYTFIDGTTTIPQTTHVTNNTNVSELYVADVSMSRLNFTAIENANNKRIRFSEHWIEIQIGGTWKRCSNYFYYTWDLQPAKNMTKIYWKNRFNTLDSFEFTGNQVINTESKQIYYNKNLPFNNGNNAKFSSFIGNKGIKKAWKTENEYKIEFNSGFVSKDDYEFLQGLVNTTTVLIPTVYLNEFFVITSWGTKPDIDFTLFTIDNVDWTANDDDTLFNLSVTLVKSINENNVR